MEDAGQGGGRIRLELRRHCRAAPDALFAAWTSEALLARFMCPGRMDAAKVTADVRVGGRYHIDMVGDQGVEYPHDGVYLVVEPARRLQFTWISLACPPELGSVITIELEPAGDCTDLTLTHDGLPDQEQREGHLIGWSSIIDQLLALTGGRTDEQTNRRSDGRTV